MNKFVTAFLLITHLIHQQGNCVQLRINNAPNTFLVPPFPEAPPKFKNGFQIQTYTRIPYIRNLNSNKYGQLEHQTDWVPISPPNLIMEDKNDKTLFNADFPEQITNNERRGRILIGNKGTTLTKTPSTQIDAKTFDKQENKHSFIYFQKLVGNDSKFKRADEKDNRTLELEQLTNVNENNKVFNDHEALSKIIQGKLDGLLKKFEGNLSKILDNAISNASDINKNRVQRSHYFNSNDVHRANGIPVVLSQPQQFNVPPTSGTSSPELISSSYWAGPPTEAGYTSPPNLNLNSNGGTLDYTVEHSGTQEIHGTSDSTVTTTTTAHESIQNHALNNHIIQNYSNANNNKSPVSIIGPQTRINNRHKSNSPYNRKPIDEIAESNKEYDTSISSYIQSPIKDENMAKQWIDINDKTLEQDSKVRRKIVEPLSKLNEPLKTNEQNTNERKRNIDDEEERVAETSNRDNRVTKRMYPFYTSVDLKGIDTFHTDHDLINNLKGINLLALDQFRRGQKINIGYNSLGHLPPDPLVSLFLSHYGRYIPHGHILSSNFRNIYSYLASNNIHNNKPFGSYKIYEDADS